MCCNFGPYRNKTYVAMSKTSGTDPQNVCCFLQPSQGVLVKGQFSPYVAYPSTIFVLSIGLSLDDLRRLVRDRLQSFERASLNTHTHRYGVYIYINIHRYRSSSSHQARSSQFPPRFQHLANQAALCHKFVAKFER